MKYNLNCYDYIIIDFSAMFVQLDSNLMKQLINNDKVFFSPTFECDCRNFYNSVPERIKTTYWNNRKEICYSALKVFNSCGTTDTYGCAKWLSSKQEPKIRFYSQYSSESLPTQARTLVIEANCALEDRIIFSGINVDVYSWSQEHIIKSSEFSSEQKYRKICKDKDPLPFYKVKAGDKVYSNIGYCTLESVLNNDGGEADIFKIYEGSDHLVKIFKTDDFDDQNQLTKQKLQNIIDLQKLGDGWDVNWLALPKTVLYADPSLTQPVGYLMKKMKGKFLSDNPLFASGEIGEIFISNKNIRVKDILDICIQFVSQYMFLLANGMYLTDYNDRNFVLCKKGSKKLIKMIDTDSYCYNEYFSGLGSWSSKNKTDNKFDLLKISEESLFIFIFKLLVLKSDYEPIHGDEFKFSDEKLKKFMANTDNFLSDIARWNSIPKNLQDYYKNVLENNGEFSVSKLLYELEVAKKQDFSKIKYIDLYQPVLNLYGNNKFYSKRLQTRIVSSKKYSITKIIKIVLFVILSVLIGCVASGTISYMQKLSVNDFSFVFKEYFYYIIDFIINILT